jgi:bacillithiol system protein YtxJ
MPESPALTSLESLDDLNTVIEASHARPVIIFKHSAYCDLSAAALESVAGFLASAPAPPPARILIVQRARLVSSEIERRFHVRHESPQALLVHKGAIRWHASHRRITGAALVAALRDAHTGALANEADALTKA